MVGIAVQRLTLGNLSRNLDFRQPLTVAQPCLIRCGRSCARRTCWPTSCRAVKLDPSLDEAKVTVAMTRIDAIWDQLFPAEQSRIFKLLIEKVIVSPTDLEVRLRPNGIEQLVLELRPEPATEAAEVTA